MSKLVINQQNVDFSNINFVYTPSQNEVNLSVSNFDDFYHAPLTAEIFFDENDDEQDGELLSTTAYTLKTKSLGFLDKNNNVFEKQYHLVYVRSN